MKIHDGWLRPMKITSSPEQDVEPDRASAWTDEKRDRLSQMLRSGWTAEHKAAHAEKIKAGIKRARERREVMRDD